MKIVDLFAWCTIFKNKSGLLPPSIWKEFKWLLSLPLSQGLLKKKAPRNRGLFYYSNVNVSDFVVPLTSITSPELKFLDVNNVMWSAVAADSTNVLLIYIDSELPSFV